MPGLNEHVRKSMVGGLVATGVLIVAIVLGSRGLQHVDPALTGYVIATLFACFGCAYRCTMWLQRPPSALYWKAGWRAFLSPRFLLRNLGVGTGRLIEQLGVQRFIWRRGKIRWGAHWLIAWGCLLASLITFPLVFGWIYFQTEGAQFQTYRAYVFGWPTVAFPVESIRAILVFHALAIAAVMVIAGVLGAGLRRWRTSRNIAAEDALPLILLLAVSVTGLVLTAGDFLFHGVAHPLLATIHEITVIATLLWLPFGKFFHIFQRPMRLGVMFYQDQAKRSGPGVCACCGQLFATRQHLEDLARLEEQLGFKYALPDTPAEHYQKICPSCRRVLLVKSRLIMTSPGGAA